MGYADDLAQGKTVELPAAETAEAPAGETAAEMPESDVAEAAEPQPPTPLPDIDPVLLDIYRKEVETHLETLRDYLRGWDAGKERAATDALLRALHTLTGSSRTTGVEAISGLCGAFEHYVKDLQSAERPLDAEGASLLQDVVNFVAETVPVLDEPGGRIGDNNRLCERLAALHEALRAELSGASITMPAPETLPEVPAESAPPPRDYDEELLEIFIEEGEEILEQSDNTLMTWRENPDDREALEALQRQLHTLKGGARMAGVVEERMSHRRPSRPQWNPSPMRRPPPPAWRKPTPPRPRQPSSRRPTRMPWGLPRLLPTPRWRPKAVNPNPRPWKLNRRR